MYQTPKSSSHEPNAENKQPVPMPQVSGITLHERHEMAEGMMSDVIFKLRVNQLVTTLRGQGLDAESTTMLNVLESLVVAGEIPFGDFMNRVQNLFPHVFDQIDTDLREKLLAMLSD